MDQAAKRSSPRRDVGSSGSPPATAQRFGSVDPLNVGPGKLRGTEGSPGLHELAAHLRWLHADLSAVIQRYPEQEILGVALSVVDRIMSLAARRLAAGGSLLAGVVTELISPATVEAGEPVRAVDAWLVVGQLLAAIGDSAPPTLTDEKGNCHSS